MILNLNAILKKILHLETLLTIGVTIVMAGVIYFSVTNQREHIRERMTYYGQDIKSLAYAGIKHPMSVGDSPSVEKQLLDIGAEMENTEIVICDFNQRIVFSTDKERIGADVSTFTGNRATLAALRTLLETAVPPRISYFEEEKDGINYLVTIHSIYNDEECHHCHGDSRRVLGGLLTRQTTDATYLAIATLRNHTIIISIIGIGLLMTIIYFLLARLVTKPITDLAAKAEELAKGNLTVSAPVHHTSDSINTLAGSFNSMVKSIKDKIEYANSLKEAIADPLIIVDTNMMVSFINGACSRLTGFSKEETEGKLNCRDILKSDICCQDETCDAACPIKKCLVSGEPVEDIRIIITNKAGALIPVMASASSLKDAQGNITGAVQIFRDISDVLEAERLRYIQSISERDEEQRKYLETRAENLLAILKQASEGNLQVRAEYHDSNEVMDKIAHHTNQMLDNLEKMYEKISSLSKGLEQEVAHRTVMLRERTLMLERAIRDLRELDRLKSAFLANMSHELRTPMNSIIGYTQLLLDRIDGEINDEQEKSLIKVENNAKHLLQLINDILDMSKIESGKIELDIQETDFTAMRDTISTFFQPVLDAKGLYLHFDFADDIPPVYIDQDKVKQIFTNLVGNAVKFTDQGGITIHAKPSTLGIASGEDPLFVEICVEDTGIGIKKDDMAKLFDKFTQINVSASRPYEGTGLGLSIARGLVVLHKGVIWVESDFGKGCRFYFTLPAQKKVMEKATEPIIELAMAEKLAEYFEKPIDLFLKEPYYLGKRVKCWEYAHCGQTSCPAYGNTERRCWLICGVHCKGVEVAKCPEKVEYCKACEVIENLVVGEFAAQKMTGEDLEGDESDGGIKKTILVIDDNPEVIELIRKNIGDDYNVLGHYTGEGAVEKAKEIKPAAITLDIMMPGKDGWEVLQELKKDPVVQDIPVIILSIVDEKKIGFSLGATEYMVKPIDKKILLHKLKNLEKLTNIKNILIVDNEPGTLSTLGRVLSESGYKITKASNNTGAIQAIHESQPDLIVLNLMIKPDEKGSDVIDYIKTNESARNIPLILITDSDLSEEKIKELDGRIRATFNKAILAEDDLLETLKNTIKKM